MLRKCAWAAVITSVSLAQAWAAGPILVVGSSSNPFIGYYREILRAEGIINFDYVDISSVVSSTLGPYEVVILGEMPLTSGQVSLFSSWVNSGGHLIAMRPAAGLASLLGLASAQGTLSNAYLAVDATKPPGAGIVSQTIQFHGTADRYMLNGAEAVAMLYSNATTPTSNPAVTLRTVGPNGGSAAAFTYDLARSIVYTRQGNPAWAGQERDGIPPRRSDDLFFGPAAGDPQPNWVDHSKIAIPQADEQQRLLVNLILHMNRTRTPVPRFWYLPFGKKAAIVMTGDDHASGGTPGRFDSFIQRSPAGCSVANWECVRATSYVFPHTPLSNSQAAAYNAQGFEIGVHFDTGCSDFTPASLQSVFASQLQSWSAAFPSLPPPRTNRTHCIVWSDWATHAEVELANGIRLDANYYHWPGSWLQVNGFMTGSGIPMRFARQNGSVIDVYQAATQLTDESDQTYPDAAITLMDNALGPQGYYGVFTANIHTDDSTGEVQRWAEQIVEAAQARGVPVISARQLLTWLDGREASAFNNLTWNNGLLTFSISPGSGANGLQAMLPATAGTRGLSALTRNGSSVTYSLQTIKGVAYAVFPALSGNYQATYATSSVSVSVSPDAVTLGQSQSQQFTATVTGTSNTSVSWSHSPALGTLTDTGLYTAPAGATGTVVITATSVADPSKSDTAVVTLTGVAPPLISAVNAVGADGGSAVITWTTDRPANSRVDYGTSPQSLTLSKTDSAPVTAHSLTLTGLTAGATYYYRVTSTDSSGLQSVWPPLSSAPASFIARTTYSIWSPSATPAAVDSGDAGPVELGLKFRSDIAGQVAGVRFYKAAANTGTHTGSLWTTSGTRLATVTFVNESASGWQTAYFSTPVQITANTTYVVSYYTPSGHYSANLGAFESAGVNSPPLRALANGVDGPNGVYVYGTGGGFPNSTYNSANYWVDVVFVPTETSPPVISAVTAYPLNGGTAQITWATDTPATSRVDYGTSPDALSSNVSSSAFVTSHSLTLTGLTPGVTYYYRVSSTNVTGGVTVTPAPPAAPGSFTENVASIWSASVAPATPDAGDGAAVELGVKFRTTAAGQVLGVRFYKSAANTGVHIGNLWSSTGQLLARATFVNETASGWQNVYFSQPVSISPNTTYVVSYFAPAGHYAATPQAFATQGVESPPLQALANGVDGPNGLFQYGSTTVFPTNSFNAANYWVDALFLSSAADTIAPVISAVSASASSTSAVVTWTTNEPATSRVDYGTSPNSLTLSASQAALTTSHSITLTGLAAGTTYYYRVSSADSSGNSAVFPTAGNPPLSFASTDLSPPVITAIAVSAGTNSASITWTTNEPATSRVDYGTSSSLGLSATNAALVTAHNIVLNGLAPGTQYYFRVTSADAASNSATSPAAVDPPLTFTTVAGSGPVISGLSATPGLNGRATITWTTNVPADSRVEYGPTTGLGTTVTDPALTTVHSIALTGLTAGQTYYYRVTSTSAGGSTSSPISSFVEMAPLSIWNSSATPGTVDPDNVPVEVGLKFRSDVAGSIVGVRFYKASTNTGTHVGNLWSSTGTLLGRVTFTNETSSGWQQANFSAPIPISANTTYVISYFAPNGHYSTDANFFTSSGVDSGPLHALRAGVDGPNGVYRYGSSSGFPNSSWQNSNYWVDVAFVPSDTTPPVVTSFSVPSTAASLTVPITSFTATDNVAVTGYLVTESATAPQPGAPGWSATPPASYTCSAAGARTLYAWARDAAGLVSTSSSATVVITLSDTTPPVVSSFTIPATATTLTVPITSFTATDNVNVTGYLVKESSAAPSPSAPEWLPAAPASYTFTSAGSKTLYAWAKDAAGNVSAAASDSVVITLQSSGVEPAGWYAGDIHVHRSCGGSPEAVSNLLNAMSVENLSVISLLADMGNGEVQNPATDLPLVNGQNASISTQSRIVHWDAEWHWDATYTQYPHQALGGHVVLLGLNEARSMWEEYTYPIFAWARQRNGIGGFAHMQYLDQGIPQSLNCCKPIEYPVEIALGAAKFISEDVDDSGSGAGMSPENFILAYYRLLNTGFRPGFAAGTDYPCNSGRPLGSLLTYSQSANGQLSYRNWIEGIAAGRTVVSRNGHAEFLALSVNGIATPGDEVRLAAPGNVSVTVQWTAAQNITGTLQLVSNGVVVASAQRSVSPGSPAVWTTSVNFPKSGWLAARRMDSDGHQVHTAAVFVIVNDLPIRVSASDAQFYVQWMDTLLTNTSPGGVWSSFFPTSRSQAQARYQAAKGIFQQIALEAAGNPTAPSLTSITPSSGVRGTTVPVTITGTNLFEGRLNVPAGVTVTNFASTSTTITANLVIAAGAATGTHSITVTTMGGGSNALNFSITSGSTPPAPTLTGITPNSGVQGASVPVTLTGTNLTGAALNLPAGITTSGAPVVTATQITAVFVIAAGASTGAKNITVTTPGGTSNAVTFTVNPALPGDSTPPVITSITATPAGNSAVIAWTTNEPSNSRVDYGTAPGALTASVSAATLVTAHSLTLTGLAPGTTYYYRVTSVDAASNSATSPAAPNPPLSFSTTTGGPLSISGLTVTPGQNGTATVTWTTNVPADSRVNYGTAAGALVLSASSAQLVTSHSITLTRLSPGGTYYFRVSSTDAAANSVTSPAAGANPASFTLFATLWSPAAVPSQIDDGDTAAVEVGMKFRADVNGFVHGVRFYKATANTGTHTANLWSSTGTLLARATFTNETASGWQQVNFAEPVPVTANTVYVVSYHAPRGHYSASEDYFDSTGVDSPPVHALREGVSGSNGVYRYTNSSAFPNSSYRSSNYWVDVVFRSASAPMARVLPESVTVETGSLRAGDASRLTSSDDVLYQVNSTTSGTRTSSWYATFTNIPKALTSLGVGYEGRNSRSCTQTISLWRWSDSTWVQLDSQSVGTADVYAAVAAPPGNLADYVSGTGEEGSVRVRVRCTATANFFSSGDLMMLTFDRN
ncbi:MAG: DUF4082 domain-containing protein [Rhodospirillales bacterium]